MKVKEIRVGNSTIEIHNDFVDPEKTESIMKKIGSIRSVRITDGTAEQQDRRVAI